ncbi:hypothetical protein WK68_24920 [Burkholderia ubonensis]|nr:hypothetical protein WK68_24920 [Burkholderia ubonensis]
MRDLLRGDSDRIRIEVGWKHVMQLVRARDPKKITAVAACEPGFFGEFAARRVAQRFAAMRLAAGQHPAGM